MARARGRGHWRRGAATALGDAPVPDQSTDAEWPFRGASCRFP